ncbi:MAG: ABC transporter ATP-binding protein, partial [Nitrospirota bacterium]
VQTKTEEKTERPRAKPEKPRKMTFRQQKDLDAMPNNIELLESEKKQIVQSLAEPAFYRNNGDKVSAAKARLKLLEMELAEMYARWEELQTLMDRVNESVKDK